MQKSISSNRTTEPPYPSVRAFIPFGLLLVLLLAGCDQNALIQKLTPPEYETAATNYIAQLKDGNFAQIEADADPSIKTEGLHKTLVEMSRIIPPGDPVSIKIVGAYQYSQSGVRQVDLAFEYQFPTNWAVIEVMLQKKDGVTTIVGLHVRPQKDSLENVHRFKLGGKTFAHYAILTWAVLMPFFIVSVFVLCCRTQIAKRKWLWFIFIPLGIGTVSINWTTGDIHVAALNFLLLGASAFAPFSGAWQISAAFPLGAILFLWRRKKLMAEAVPPPIPGEHQAHKPETSAP